MAECHFGQLLSHGTGCYGWLVDRFATIVKHQDRDLFTDEQQVKRAIRDVAAMLAVPRHAMNIMADSKCVSACYVYILLLFMINDNMCALLKHMSQGNQLLACHVISACVDAPLHAANQVVHCSAVALAGLLKIEEVPSDAAFDCSKHMCHIHAAGTTGTQAGKGAQRALLPISSGT